jgi:hypothetical protein
LAKKRAAKKSFTPFRFSNVQLIAASSFALVFAVIGFAMLRLSLASGSNVCANYGNALCMDNRDDGGYGTQVTMSNAGARDANFKRIPVSFCNAGALTTDDCPIDKFPGYTVQPGLPTIRIQDTKTNLCVGSNGVGTGQLVSCGDSYGRGAGNGAIMVYDPATHMLLNRFWTNSTGVPSYVCSGSSLQSPLIMNESESTVASSNKDCNWSGAGF